MRHQVKQLMNSQLLYQDSHIFFGSISMRDEKGEKNNRPCDVISCSCYLLFHFLSLMTDQTSEDVWITQVVLWLREILWVYLLSFSGVEEN
jgi:hypothetical protein